MSASLVAVRPLALPNEHGGWSLLAEPILLGLLVAGSAPGLLIAGGAIAIFLGRHPLKFAVNDWLRRRYPRTPVCEALAAAYVSAGALLFIGAWSLGGIRPLLVLGVAAPLAAVQFASDVRRKGRALTPEIAGAAAPAVCAGAIAIAGGATTAVAAALVILMICRSVPTVLYVRFALRGENRNAMLCTHAAALITAALLSWTAAAAMAMLFARALPRRHEVTAMQTGFRELGWGLLTVTLIAIGYR